MKIADKLNFKIDTHDQKEKEREIYCTNVESWSDGEGHYEDEFDKCCWTDTDIELTDDELDTYDYEIRDKLHEAISDYYVNNIQGYERW